MKRINKCLKIYWPFAKISIQSNMQFSVNFFMFILGGMTQVFVNYYLWKAVFQNSSYNSLGGFKLNEMVIYVFMSYVTSRFVISNADRLITNEVRDGSIAMSLIKPINYYIRILFDSIGNVIYNFVFIGFPIWIGLMVIRFAWYSQVPPSVGTIICYLISMLMGFLIIFLFNLSFGLLAFIVINNFGLASIKNLIIGIFSGQLIPITFFPDSISWIFKYLPFMYTNYVPVMIYLNKIKGYDVFINFMLQLIWILVLVIIDIFIWRSAIKHLSIQGG
ncbi:ABC-2 family transporter protein [Clostridium sp.]|uniref:ABC transporter permease n=1 Tax=Clostridium sp. TaxID=1506 RepID=UPI0026027B09|nr:ABC-2 family transporter protein [Clostridium sp.]